MNEKVSTILFSTLIISIYFLIRNLAPYLMEAWGGESTWLRLMIYYGTYALPVLLFVGIGFGAKSIPEELGMNRSFPQALKWSLLFTLPMLVGYAVLGTLNPEYTLWKAFLGAVCPATFEELVFRAFVFGQLFRHHRWGFVPASAVNALVFGAAHLWQGNGFGDSLGVFMVTFMGAVWFAWLYVEWDFNLWVPIMMHLLMNLYWGLFDIDSTALGGVWANVFRAATIALSIIFTLRLRPRRAVNRRNLWWQVERSAKPA
ncbi:MAG: CPBP family intramembrane glutamic endopeptidase [Bacteroidota bacterium]